MSRQLNCARVSRVFATRNGSNFYFASNISIDVEEMGRSKFRPLRSSSSSEGFLFCGLTTLQVTTSATTTLNQQFAATMSYFVVSISNDGGAPEQAYRKMQSAGACPEAPFAGEPFLLLCSDACKWIGF